jgi:hypothetical protein
VTVTYRKCQTSAGDVEAVLNLRAYSATGFYRIEVSAFGLTKANATQALQASLVQASAAVSLAINDVMAGRT